MLRLRPYKKCDAKYIVNWIKDEVSFRKWSADRFDHYPISAEDINAHYSACDDSDSFFEMTAFDESEVVGHLIMRFTDEEKKKHYVSVLSLWMTPNEGWDMVKKCYD